ncbi:hypothetical protein CHS0354_037748 [Potamilus streckersoni]|uniref:Uncharacterized protein n=1 Tax=Potamilus streckersoni TaxID=2493646 RepID=A0AAE0T070_9BIVA|nr:hypothetical protein CHS0354_037748 [Potamilus streckersoni]
MDRKSFEKESDCSSIITASSMSCGSSTIYSRSSARYFDHFEIFRSKPEILKFCFNTEDINENIQEFSLEELGLDPYLCGYLGRENAGTLKEYRGTARLKFLDELEEKCHSQPSILEHGRIISIQYSGKWLTDTEVDTWKSQVVEIFKKTVAVRSCKVSFPEKQKDINIVKRKFNHHLKERNVVAYTCSDPEHATEIAFAYERDLNEFLDKPDDESKRDFVEKLADDISHQSIITKSKSFEDQQMEVLKIRYKWWKSILVDVKTEDKTVQISGLEEDVNQVFFKIKKALLSASRATINLNVISIKYCKIICKEAN